MSFNTLQAVSLSLFIASSTAHAGLFDTLKEAKEAVETAQDVLKIIPSQDGKEEEAKKQPAPSSTKSTAPPATANSSKPAATGQTATAPKKSVQKSDNGDYQTPDFVNIPQKVAKISYDNCPKVDVMGLKLGQNISTLAKEYPLKLDWHTYSRNGFSSDIAKLDGQGLGVMLVEDRERQPENLKYPDGQHYTTVYSPKFDAMNHFSINKHYNYEFSDQEYAKVVGTIKAAGRHDIVARFYLKPPKDFRSKFYKDTAKITTDLNGDIAAIYVTRVLPVEINVSDTHGKLTEKYGKPHQVVKGADGKLLYQLSWTAKYNHHPRKASSEITYRLTCHDAYRASVKEANAMLRSAQQQFKSMRKETGVSVDI